MQLSHLTDILDILIHKNHWMMIGLATSGTAVAIPYYQRIWFTAGDYGVTGLDVGWTLATVMAFVAIIKTVLDIVSMFKTKRTKK